MTNGRRASVATLSLLGATTLACGLGAPIPFGTPNPAPAASPAPARAARGESLADDVQRLVAPLDAEWVRRFYARRGFHAAWVDGAGRTSLALDLLDLIERAGEDGLDAERYETDDAREMLSAAQRAGPDAAEALAMADILVTEVALAWARDLSLGRVDPATIDALWRSGNAFDPVSAVGDAADSGTVHDLADRLRPPHLGYSALRVALARSRAAYGDSAEPWARRIELNLERWRWLPRDLGQRYVIVNFAAFEAVAVDGGSEALRTRVVAGRPDWPTPIASGQLASVVANPRWNVPHDIAVEEILPILRRNPAFLRREGITVYRGAREIDPRTISWKAVSDTAFPYRLVQAPGPRNPLGRVKIVFTNPFNVALHDTPARALFDRPERAESHGCVRLERAVDLAAWALGPAGADSLRAALKAPVERALSPGGPVMVHLVYWTAWVGDGGALRLHEDVYGWDERLERALAPATLTSFTRRSPPVHDAAR